MAHGLQVGVHDDLIVVTDPVTRFYAIYAKPSGQYQLILRRCRLTKDHPLLVEARQAADGKARELGWII